MCRNFRFITLEEGRAQALQQLLAERQLNATTVDANLWSAYRAAVAARDRAEPMVARASATEILARRTLETQRKQGAASAVLDRAQVAVQTTAKQFEEAQSAYTVARLKADQLWADIKKSLPRAYAPPLGLEQAQQVLPPDTLFVAFSTGEEETHVFLLCSGSASSATVKRQGSEVNNQSAIRHPPSAIENSLSVYTVAVPLKELQALVDRLRVEVTTRLRWTAGATASRLLFAKLFPPGESRQAVERARRLLISPDGPLWDVSFAALVTNAVGAPRYLGADKPITYAQSLTLLAQSRSDVPRLGQGGQVQAVVVGNPIFDRIPTEVASRRPLQRPIHQTGKKPLQRPIDRALESAPTEPIHRGQETAPTRIRGERSYLFIDGQPPEPLPETKTEAVEIAQLYGGEPLTEGRATEAALRERIEQADVIHLATHGYLNPVRAMSSGVLLTAPEKEPDIGETANDGALLAWEIYSQLKLNAELVVFSACETGRRRHVRGEGIVGLTRALQYAGARSIVASQWKVPDKSTSELMVAFHRLLRQGVAKDEALRRAMALVRNNPVTAHPYYWAGFFFLGDPDNLIF